MNGDSSRNESALIRLMSLEDQARYGAVPDTAPRLDLQLSSKTWPAKCGQFDYAIDRFAVLRIARRKSTPRRVAFVRRPERI